MRIIGGIAGGTAIQVPKGLDVRPTPDLVRQAVFNSLGTRVEGAHVLELFGGTGALSLECLSRGAGQAVCVEKSGKHAQFIRRNLEQSRLEPHRLDIRVQDAFTAVAQLAGLQHKFSLVLADPPYGEKNVGKRSTSLAQKLFDDTNLPAIVTDDGVFVLGHTRRDTLTIPDFWEEFKILKHGDSWMRFLRKKRAAVAEVLAGADAETEAKTAE